MSATHSAQKISFYPFLAVGLIAGGLLALIVTDIPHTFLAIFPTPKNGSPYALRYLLYYWIGLYGLMFLLAYPYARSLKRLCVMTLIPSVLASLPFYWGGSYSASQFFLMLLSAYALTAFHINDQANKFHCDYPTLFYAVWDTFVKLLIMLFFTLFCWLVLFLCAALFDFIGIHFFTQLIAKVWFDCWITAVFMSMGLYIATETAHVVQNIKSVLLLICKYLFIPLAIIGILFIVALVIKTSQHHITLTSQYLFSTIGFLSALFLNGVYQDGLVGKPYPTVLLWICRIFIWMTPIFTLLAIYANYFNGYNNISTNGWNSDNFPFLFNLLLLLLYNVTYAIIALFPQKQWFKPIERANILLAIVLIAVTTITTHPLFTQQFPTFTAAHPVAPTQSQPPAPKNPSGSPH